MTNSFPYPFLRWWLHPAFLNVICQTTNSARFKQFMERRHIPSSFWSLCNFWNGQSKNLVMLNAFKTRSVQSNSIQLPPLLHSHSTVQLFYKEHYWFVLYNKSQFQMSCLNSFNKIGVLRSLRHFFPLFPAVKSKKKAYRRWYGARFPYMEVPLTQLY